MPKLKFMILPSLLGIGLQGKLPSTEFTECFIFIFISCGQFGQNSSNLKMRHKVQCIECVQPGPFHCPSAFCKIMDNFRDPPLLSSFSQAKLVQKVNFLPFQNFRIVNFDIKLKGNVCWTKWMQIFMAESFQSWPTSHCLLPPPRKQWPTPEPRPGGGVHPGTHIGYLITV